MNGSRIREVHTTTPDVSLVFPTYNPGPRLPQSLQAIDSFLDATAANWEFVFVCDGCTDQSANVIRAWQPRCGTVRIIEYTPNRGKGYAVRQGLLAAAGRYRIFTDVDLAYSFEDISRVVDAMRNGHEVVIASRTHAESQIQLRPAMIGSAFRRHVQSHVFSRLVRLLLPVSHRDTQAGLKGLTASAVRLIVPRVICDGFGFDCELLTACHRLGLAVSEIPVHVRYDDAGTTTNFRSTMRMVGDLFRIRRAWRDAATTDQVIIPPMRYREAG